MEKIDISETEFDKRKGTDGKRNLRSEEFKAIYNLRKKECCCLSYQIEDDFKKARARVAGVKSRFPMVFEYFTDKENRKIYIKKQEEF